MFHSAKHALDSGGLKFHKLDTRQQQCTYLNCMTYTLKLVLLQQLQQQKQQYQLHYNYYCSNGNIPTDTYTCTDATTYDVLHSIDVCAVFTFFDDNIRLALTACVFRSPGFSGCFWTYVVCRPLVNCSKIENMNRF